MKISNKKAPKIEEPPTSQSIGVSSGSTLLNLALTDTKECGFHLGRISNIVGDSSSGKSILSMSILAEACRDHTLDGHRLIYDDAEYAMSFDIGKLFGSKLANRVEIIEGSTTVEQFYATILRLLGKDQPFIYILDSLDALSTGKETERAQDCAKSGELDDGYKMEKAKISSEILRQIASRISKSKSLLIVVSQTRDNIGFGFEKRTKSGGRSWKFYMTHEIWLTAKAPIKSKTIQIGTQVEAKVKKNKITGKVRRVEFPVFYDYGVDDIGSMVDYLCDNDVTEVDGIKFGTRKRSTIFKEIEERNAYRKLMESSEATWLSVEEQIKLDRKPRYE